MQKVTELVELISIHHESIPQSRTAMLIFLESTFLCNRRCFFGNFAHAYTIYQQNKARRRNWPIKIHN